SNIRLKAGPSKGSPPVEFEPTSLTIFVGPNNSGKSAALRELSNFCNSGSHTTILLDQIVLSPWKDVEAELQRVTIGSLDSGSTLIIGKPHRSSHSVTTQGWRILAENPNINTQQYCQTYLSWNCIFLDGNSRLQLVQCQPLGNLKQPGNQ